MKIKGIFLKDYVKIVKDTPDLDWKSWLTEEDWEIVNGMVYATTWYPVETMGRIGRGIFEMRSNRNYEVVRMHGRARATESFDEITFKLLLKNDPASSLRAYAGIARRYVDELEVTFLDSGPDRARVGFFPVDSAPAWDLFREIQAGTLERLVELNGGKNPRASFASETREGREACIMTVVWE